MALAATPAAAQVTGSNLLEAQFGNYPRSYVERGPTNRQDYYDQANLEYTFGSGLVGLRFETNRNSENKYTYDGFTQRYLDLSRDRYRLRVGNFYTILGRGLVHRSFELDGVVLDQRFPRSRYSPSRDVDGVLAEATLGPVSAIGFSGTPNGGTSSLAGEEFGIVRYAGQLSGAQVAATVYRDARIGVTYATNSVGTRQTELGSGFVEVDPLHVAGIDAVSLPLYVEYAQSDRTFGQWWSMKVSDRVPHALYASANLLWDRVGVSAEWKDYSQFRNGFNDPPSLVREHSQPLLNRSTHVLEADREEGYQLEGSYRPVDWATVTTNWSRSDLARANRFEERFVEVRTAPRGGERWESTVFYDRSRDELIGIADRRTAGLASTVRFLARWSTALDLERLTAHRAAGARTEPFEDLYLSATVARAGIGSAAVVWVRTTDPLDLSRVDPGNQPLHLVGGVLNARLAEGHEAILFVGKRRGGLACTAGTCYEVQALEGAELRLLSRF